MVWGMCSNLVINALFIAADAAADPGRLRRLVDRPGRDRGRRLRDAGRAWPRRGSSTGSPPAGSPCVVAWSFVPLLVPLIFWNHPAVVMVALSTGVFLNPAGNAGIGSYRMSITPPELIGRVQSDRAVPRLVDAAAGAGRWAAGCWPWSAARPTMAVLAGLLRAGRADPDPEPQRAVGAAAGASGRRLDARRSEPAASRSRPDVTAQPARTERGRPVGRLRLRVLAVDQLRHLADQVAQPPAGPLDRGQPAGQLRVEVAPVGGRGSARRGRAARPAAYGTRG